MSLLTIRTMTQAATITGTPPVTQNFNVSSGPGESPKAAIYELTSATALDTTTTPAKPSIGMTDGSAQYAIGTLLRHNTIANVANNESRADNATVIQVTLNTSNAIGAEASWGQWNTDGSQVSWADLPGNAVQVKATYFFGTDISANLSLATSIGQDLDYSITGLSFAPTMAIMIGGATFTADQTMSGGRYAIGYACRDSFTGGVLQGGVWYNGLDDTSDYNQTLYDTRILRSINITTGAEAVGIETKSFNSDGITFTQRDGTATITTPVLLLGLPKHRVWVGIPTITTSSAGNKSITEPGFKPKAYFMFGTLMTAKNTIASAGTVLHGSHGIATGSESICASIQAEDAVSTTDTRSMMSTKLLDLVDDAGATAFAASHVAMGQFGPTINVDTATGSDVLSLMCVISGDPVMVPQLRQPPPRVSRLMRM